MLKAAYGKFTGRSRKQAYSWFIEFLFDARNHRFNVTYSSSESLQTLVGARCGMALRLRYSFAIPGPLRK